MLYRMYLHVDKSNVREQTQSNPTSVNLTLPQPIF